MNSDFFICAEPYSPSRSLAACELLYNAGYRNLFWVQGGLEAAEEEVFFLKWEIRHFLGISNPIVLFYQY